MSRLKSKARYGVFVSLLTILTIWLFASTVHSANFCVSNATELQSDLTTAASNNQDDVIQIVQGAYVGNFVYASTEAFGLTIEGGYTEGCMSRVVDPTNTVFDANETGSVLVFSTPGTNVNIVVDGFTLQNGVAGYLCQY